MEIKLAGYSERGRVFSFFVDILTHKNADALKLFLGEIKFLDNSSFDETKIDKVMIYIEPTLSEFGNPDVVISGIRSNGNKKETFVIFIEAKVDVYIEKEVETFNKAYETPLKTVSNFSSNLIVQLYLKYRLVKKMKDGLSFDNRTSKKEIEVFFDEDNPISKRLAYYDKQHNIIPRKTGTTKFVKNFLRGRGTNGINASLVNYYLIALVPGNAEKAITFLEKIKLEEMKNDKEINLGAIGWSEVNSIVSKNKENFEIYSETIKLKS
jgi:hypothetical protein